MKALSTFWELASIFASMADLFWIRWLSLSIRSLCLLILFSIRQSRIDVTVELHSLCDLLELQRHSILYFPHCFLVWIDYDSASSLPTFSDLRRLSTLMALLAQAWIQSTPLCISVANLVTWLSSELWDPGCDKSATSFLSFWTNDVRRDLRERDGAMNGCLSKNNNFLSMVHARRVAEGAL